MVIIKNILDVSTWAIVYCSPGIMSRELDQEQRAGSGAEQWHLTHDAIMLVA